MAFVKAVPPLPKNLPANLPAPAGPRHGLRRCAVLSIVGFLAGVGLVVSGSSLVRAADDAGVLEFLIAGSRASAARNEAAPARSRPPRTAARAFSALHRVAARAARHVAPRRIARAAPPRATASRAPVRRASPPAPRYAAALSDRLTRRGTPVTAPMSIRLGHRTACVRQCDGYIFPLGNLGGRRDLPLHRAACEAACPGADTALFTIPAGADDLARAVSPTGQRYASLAQASAYLTRRVPGCSCQGPDNVSARFPLERDRTLRPGDIVAGREGGYVFTKRGGFESLRRSGALTDAHRRQATALLGLDQRELQRRGLRRSLRQAGTPKDRPALASIAGGPDGAEAARIVMPSPWR